MVERSGSDVVVTVDDDHVGTVEMRRPPNNFFDVALIRALVGAYEQLDDDPACRAIVLCSEGKHFCAGADFSPKERTPEQAADEATLYDVAVKLFENRTPVVAAIQGGAIGGGLGLACSADFRVACPEARFTANFARLGFHQGFALSVTLRRAVGPQRAQDLLLTGRSVSGEDAAGIGLCDAVADDPRAAAVELAAEIAASAPLSVPSIRATLRRSLVAEVLAALDLEADAQAALLDTADFAEGIAASIGKRPPQFVGS